MKSLNKITTLVLSMLPLMSSAVDIGLSVGLTGAGDVYYSSDLDFEDYNVNRTAGNGQIAFNAQKSIIGLDTGYGASSSIFTNVIVSDLLSIGVEGGYSTTFYQKGNGDDVFIGTDAIGLPTNIDSAVNPISTKDKNIVKFNLPYLVANLGLRKEIFHTGFVPYISGGAGIVFANLTFEDNEITGDIKTVSGTTNAVPMKDFMKRAVDFKYKMQPVYQAEAGIGYKMTDNLELSTGYRFTGSFNRLEFHSGELDEAIINYDQMYRHSVTLSAKYNVDL